MLSAPTRAKSATVALVAAKPNASGTAGLAEPQPIIPTPPHLSPRLSLQLLLRPNLYNYLPLLRV